jgi:hypothetical protein
MCVFWWPSGAYFLVINYYLKKRNIFIIIHSKTLILFTFFGLDARACRRGSLGYCRSTLLEGV